VAHVEEINRVLIAFDEEAETCTIVPKEQLRD